jgi:cell division protein ZapA
MSNTVIKDIIINNSKYRILCERDEINKINELSKRLDDRIKRISETSESKLNDITLLLFAALELEDIVLTSEGDKTNLRRKKLDEDKIIDYVVEAIEKITKKVQNES